MTSASLNGRVTKLEEQVGSEVTEVDLLVVYEWISTRIHDALDGHNGFYMLNGKLHTYLRYDTNEWAAWDALKRYAANYGATITDVDGVRYWIGHYDEELEKFLATTIGTDGS